MVARLRSFISSVILPSSLIWRGDCGADRSGDPLSNLGLFLWRIPNEEAYTALHCRQYKNKTRSMSISRLLNSTTLRTLVLLSWSFDFSTLILTIFLKPEIVIVNIRYCFNHLLLIHSRYKWILQEIFEPRLGELRRNVPSGNPCAYVNMQLEIQPGTKKKFVRNKAIPSRAGEPAALAIYAPPKSYVQAKIV